MKTARPKTARQALVDLYARNRDKLDSYHWEVEESRWEELVACLLIGAGVDSAAARSAVDLLGSLQYMAPSALASANKQEHAFLVAALQRVGVDAGKADQLVSVLVNLASTVRKRWSGFIQRYLREHGTRMAEDLEAILKKEGLEAQDARRAAILWLQNVANLPLLASGEERVRTFCSRHNISDRALLEAADSLGLNVAVIDDLLELEPPRNARKKRR